jgi:two-component system CheB/CheR fusion protein
MTEMPYTQQTKALLHLLLEQSKDHALILTDAAGLVVGWFPGAEQVFGYTPPEMIGQPVLRLFTPEDRERGLADHELEIARRDGRSEEDRWMLRKDGNRVWTSGIVMALRDKGGALCGFGKVLRDRTDVRGQVESLENRLSALLKADERKNIFLGTLAHELRNPLAPLVNALQLMRLTRPADPDLVYPVKLIERQVEFLRRMVDDLLDLTRIGAGKIELQKARVDLNEALRRAAEACRPRAEERRQAFHVLLPPTPIPVEADPARLQQVFVNLLTNAVKYTPEAGTVWLKSTVEGNEAVARVEDTGVGIAEAMLPRIFDLFTQEEESRYRSDGGLGIGLSLVKSLVTLHGGTVQVRSEGRDKGSEFTVRLPLRPEPDGAPPAET